MSSKVFKKAGIGAAFLAIVLLSSGRSFAYDRRSSYSLSRSIMGGYYEKLGDIDKALDQYRNAVAVDRQNAYLHLSLAAAYIKKNEVDKATAELTLASKLEPEAVEPHAVLALLYFTQNKPEDAGREYGAALEKAVLLEPKNAAIYKNLAALYMERGDLEKAERAYKAAIGLAPSDHEAYFFLAHVYAGRKNKAEELKSLRKAIELKPDYHPALNYLGYTLVEDNTSLDEAGRLLEKAVALDPNNGAYIDSRGWLRFRQGRFKEALSDLENASKLLQDPVIYEHLGDVYVRLKDPAKARASWEKSLELDDKQESVRGKLDALKIK